MNSSAPVSVDNGVPPTGLDQMKRRCIMCGAEPGEPCTVISGGTGYIDPRLDGLKPGDVRPVAHFYR